MSTKSSNFWDQSLKNILKSSRNEKSDNKLPYFVILDKKLSRSGKYFVSFSRSKWKIAFVTFPTITPTLFDVCFVWNTDVMPLSENWSFPLMVHNCLFFVLDRKNFEWKASFTFGLLFFLLFFSRRLIFLNIMDIICFNLLSKIEKETATSLIYTILIHNFILPGTGRKTPKNFPLFGFHHNYCVLFEMGIFVEKRSIEIMLRSPEK